MAKLRPPSVFPSERGPSQIPVTKLKLTIFGVAVAGSAVAASLAGGPVSLFLWTVPSVGALVFLVAHGVWNRHFWKFMPRRTRPIIFGTWKGELTYYFRKDGSAKLHIGKRTIYGVVRQSGQQVTYEQFSEPDGTHPHGTHSHTTYSEWRVHDDGKWHITGAYANAGAPGALESHAGSYDLTALEDCIAGPYWNNRWSRGNISLSSRDERIAQTAQQAQDFFSPHEEEV